MIYEIFESGIDEIYATFGKKKPEYRVLEAIYNRVERLPESFMAFTVKYFQNQNELPKNVGLFLMQEIWPEYLRQNPDKRAYNEFGACPNCLADMPGFRRVYEPFEMNGKIYYHVHIFRCPCGNAPNPNNEHVFTDDEILAKGWATRLPFYYEQEELPESWRKMICHDAGIRQEPVQEQQEDEYIPF